jgi:hypothetical protein
VSNQSHRLSAIPARERIGRKARVNETKVRREKDMIKIVIVVVHLCSSRATVNRTPKNRACKTYLRRAELALIHDACRTEGADIKGVCKRDGVRDMLAQNIKLSRKILVVKAFGLGRISMSIARGKNHKRLKDARFTRECSRTKDGVVVWHIAPREDAEIERLGNRFKRCLVFGKRQLVARLEEDIADCILSGGW